ncbi:MAG: orotidine-5'-phosphate decarboxylase [Acidobacteria bacterium]|nr:MAG: orotidine-5'-phosphate decarboxylase [Acidobacteriota bacterium]
MNDHPALSQKKIPRRERLILALDVPGVTEAKGLVDRLGDAVRFYKIGLQLFMAGGYYELIEWLKGKNKQVFVDLKFFDVPETVKLAVAQLKGRGVTFATVHGNDAILKAAVDADSGVQVLAVTVLTSLDRGDLADLGFECDVESLVLSRARRALQIGCAGVISSGLEAPRLRQHLGQNLLIVSPGIRPVENKLIETDGRPIRRAADPRAKAEEIQGTIARIFGE